MGQFLSFAKSKESIKLCEEVVDDSAFSICVTIHTLDKIDSYVDLLNHLSYLTHPVLSYTYCKSIYLLYNPDEKYPAFRSNIAGDIICGLSSEVTRYCISNKICEPYYVEVDISKEPHDVAKKSLLTLIEEHKYYGKLHGFDLMSREIIDEQFAD